MTAAENPRAIIGGNSPPSAVDLAKPIAEEVNTFLSDHPVLMDEDEARAAKLMHDRFKSVLESIETERKSKTDPLNAQVKAINGAYHQWHNADPKRPTTWDKLFQALLGRMTVFARRLEDERIAAAEVARAAAAEAERKAREAEQREREAAATAAAGVCDVDIGAATEEADSAFSAFRTASRFAQRAERDTKVRIGGGLGKVSTLRDKEILIVTDWKAAISDIAAEADGLPAVIADAILTAARTYRKVCGALPDGISRTTERSL